MCTGSAAATILSHFMTSRRTRATRVFDLSLTNTVAPVVGAVREGRMRVVAGRRWCRSRPCPSGTRGSRACSPSVRIFRLSLVWPQPVALSRLKTGTRISSRIDGQPDDAELAGLAAREEHVVLVELAGLDLVFVRSCCRATFDRAPRSPSTKSRSAGAAAGRAAARGSRSDIDSARPPSGTDPGVRPGFDDESCASWKRSCDQYGLMPVAWYSLPMPRTKPVMMRPFDRLSSIANSPAMLTGLFTSGRARPTIATLALLARAIRLAAIRLGAGTMP